MNARKDQLRSAVKYAAGVFAAVALAGCSAIYQKHGYTPTEEQLAEVVVGVDTKDSVAETVGIPTASGVLNDGGYYYVSTLMRTRGAGATKPVSRSLVAINFDSRDVVSGIERYSLEDGKVIPLERRVTSSSVEDKTFIRQLLGSLGNFNPGSLLEE
ncbi:outer membrane protein assembly factor BamE [Pseudophaeobacter sp.]|jgi:outer membrane protein assembly factor BamE (lipoprotein component of BamABCDE complex)|uniref:outer membrane protein assembly factor BamE n=1 Tax=Pseudophaeobacter TaxID=1541822 RepID=UPI0025E10DB2|nr:outer membrane protein assembly factor BamE [uncultured Pseudophaeobacter sp.]